MRRAVLGFWYAVVVLATASVRADLVQSGNLDMTPGGNDLLSGTGIWFTNYVWTGDGQLLNMSGCYIKNTVDTSGFKLDLNGGAITNGGSFNTARSSTAGNIAVTNAGSIMVGTIDAACTGTANSAGNGGDVYIYHRGALTVGDVKTYDSNSYNHAGRITFNGDVGIAGGSKAPFQSGSLLAHNNNQVGVYDNSVSIQGYTTVTITGAVSTYCSYRGNNGGSLTIGTEFPDSGRVGNVIIRGAVDLHGVEYGAGGVGGSVGIYSTGNVLFQDIGGIPQNITVYGTGAGKAGTVTIKHDGALAFNDITGTISSSGSPNVQPTVLLNGDLPGDGASGALTGRDILVWSANAYQHAQNIAISGYTGVTLRNLDTHVGGNAGSGNSGNGGTVSITNITGAVSITGNIDTSAADSNGTAGQITIAASGDILIGGTINANAARGDLYDGALVLTNWGPVCKISLTNGLDLSLVKSASFYASRRHSEILGVLANFPTNAPNNGKLDAPGRQWIHYDAAVSSNAYLGGLEYALQSGGLLVPGPGPGRGTVVTFR